MICEILDRNTQSMLAINKRITMLSDFVQSKYWVSQCVAMITVKREVNFILKAFLNNDGGMEFVLHSPSRYLVATDEHTSFNTLQKKAFAKQELLIGFQHISGRRQQQEENTDHTIDTVINPPDKYALRQWMNVMLIVIEKKHNNEMEPCL
jgi:hypothetical protein